MRLLIAEPNCSPGTETVSLGIVPELLARVECLVWAMPPHRIAHYRELVPASDRLIYEELFWPVESRFHWRLLSLLRRFDVVFPDSRLGAWLRTRLTETWLQHLVEQHRLTHFFTTWIFNVGKPRLPVPMGAMAMDLNWQRFPQNFPESSRESLDRSFASWLAEADVVFPISEFTAQEMNRAFPNLTRRMKTVPHGARVRVPGVAARGEAASRVIFYYPASALAHKDHLTAIEAALALFRRGHDFDLVFSGGSTECFLAYNDLRSNACSETIRKFLEEHREVIRGRIKVLGTVDRAQVDTLFAEARAIVLPSRFEGFGLPLLEAIEQGATVICTDIPPFLEQIARYDYADHATTFPAGDAARLAALLEAALKSPAPAHLTPKEIAARTQRWTWKDAADAYVGALQEAAP